MKKIYITIILILAIATGAYFYTPEVLDLFQTSRSYARQGLQVKRVHKEGSQEYFEYAEGGQGKTILFVHGFHANKATWLSYTQELIKKYHVIAVDLSGHGGSSQFANQRYDMYSMAENLHEFIVLKKLDSFYLVGSSMGGGIISIYAKDHPEVVEKLVLMNPLGIDLKEKSELQKMMAEGKNILFPNSLEDIDEYFSYVINKQLEHGSYFKKYILAKLMRDRAFYLQAFAEMVKSTPLDEVLPHIQAQTLIIAGGKDRILHPNTFLIFKAKIPNSQIVIIEDGGHVFTGENLQKAIKEMDSFFSQK